MSEHPTEVQLPMLGGKTAKEIYELKGKGRSMRGIAKDLGKSRNTVSKQVNSTELPKPKPRGKRGSKLDAYIGYIEVRPIRLDF